MKTNSRDLIKAFSEFVGLDPKNVTSLTIEAHAKSNLLTAKAELIVKFSEDELSKFLETLEKNQKTFFLIVE